MFLGSGRLSVVFVVFLSSRVVEFVLMVIWFIVFCGLFLGIFIGDECGSVYLRVFIVFLSDF